MTFNHYKALLDNFSPNIHHEKMRIPNIVKRYETEKYDTKKAIQNTLSCNKCYILVQRVMVGDEGSLILCNKDYLSTISIANLSFYASAITSQIRV